MDMNDRAKVRDFIYGLLHERDDTEVVTDSESLFASGRLDSLSAVEVVEFLEKTFGIDFSETDFGIERIDSIDAIAALILRSLRISSPCPTRPDRRLCRTRRSARSIDGDRRFVQWENKAEYFMRWTMLS
jgi:acyl carrier protein